MNKIQFNSRKEVSNFLKEKGVDTSNWTEEKWQSINKSPAEIHIQALAESMWDAMNESEPKQLKAGEWHIPFGDTILIPWKKGSNLESNTQEVIKIATARCARLSYMNHEGEINYEKDIELHDRLLSMNHMSPFEHVARCMSEEEYYNFVKGVVLEYESGNRVFSESAFGWCNNFRGWVPYRYLIETK